MIPLNVARWVGKDVLLGPRMRLCFLVLLRTLIAVGIRCTIAFEKVVMLTGSVVGLETIKHSNTSE